MCFLLEAGLKAKIENEELFTYISQRDDHERK